MSEEKEINKENKQQSLYSKFKLSSVYVQDADGESDNGDQVLKIKTANCGGGDYFIIETKRWAFDNPDELFAIISEFADKYKLLNIQNQ